MRVVAFLAIASAIVLAGCSNPSDDRDPPEGGTNGVSGVISGNAAWSSDTYVSGSVSVQSGAKLTLGAGIEVTFAPGASLSIFEGSSLEAEGTAEQPIVFMGAAASAWGGIRFEDESIGNSLAYCEVMGVASGGYAVTVDSGAAADIRNCQFHGNSGGGIDATLCASGTVILGNRFYDNGDYGLAASQAAQFDKTNLFSAEGESVDPADPGSGLLFSGGVASGACTLDNVEVPYFFSENVNVYGDLVFARGATAAFAEGVRLTVFEGGSLTAEGTAANPNTFKAADAASSWGGIYFEDESEDNSLAYCRIGGVDSAYAVTVDFHAYAEIDHCAIGGNGAGGVYASQARVGSEVASCSFGDNGDDGVNCFDLVYNDGVSIGSLNLLSSSLNVDD